MAGSCGWKYRFEGLWTTFYHVMSKVNKTSRVHHTGSGSVRLFTPFHNISDLKRCPQQGGAWFEVLWTKLMFSHVSATGILLNLRHGMSIAHETLMQVKQFSDYTCVLESLWQK